MSVGCTVCSTVYLYGNGGCTMCGDTNELVDQSIKSTSSSADMEIQSQQNTIKRQDKL